MSARQRKPAGEIKGGFSVSRFPSPDFGGRRSAFSGPRSDVIGSGGHVCGCGAKLCSVWPGCPRRVGHRTPPSKPEHAVSGIARPNGPAWCAVQAPEGGTPEVRGLMRPWPRLAPACCRYRRRGEESRTGGSPSLPSWVGPALPRGPIYPAGPAQPTSANTDSWGNSPNPTQRPSSASAPLTPTSSGTPTGIFPHTTSTDRPSRSHPGRLARLPRAASDAFIRP